MTPCEKGEVQTPCMGELNIVWTSLGRGGQRRVNVGEKAKDRNYREVNELFG
jgi:hypothetical protein